MLLKKEISFLFVLLVTQEIKTFQVLFEQSIELLCKLDRLVLSPGFRKGPSSMPLQSRPMRHMLRKPQNEDFGALERLAANRGSLPIYIYIIAYIHIFTTDILILA